MEEIKPAPGGQTIMENSKELFPLTSSDIQIIKSKFKKKQKIVFYCMLIFLIAGALVSVYAVLEYGLSRFENFVPFLIGVVAVIVCILVLVMFRQEINLELNNNQKCIYRGVVSKRSETSTRTGFGKNRDTYYSYFIYLGEEICFENRNLYFEINEGDTIDVQITEKLKIVLFKKIEKNKAVAGAMPEVIDEHGPLLEIKYKQEVKQRIEFLSDEEISALKTQEKRRKTRILIVGIIFVMGLGASAEFNLWIDSYTWDEALAFRLGFWGSPLAFFYLLFYRRVLMLSKDIHSGKKIIVFEKLINKEESYSEAAKAYTYTLKGIRGNIEVSKVFFNSIGPGDDFEIHKTNIRKVFLAMVSIKNEIQYRNPDIFKTK